VAAYTRCGARRCCAGAGPTLRAGSTAGGRLLSGSRGARGMNVGCEPMHAWASFAHGVENVPRSRSSVSRRGKQLFCGADTCQIIRCIVQGGGLTHRSGGRSVCDSTGTRRQRQAELRQLRARQLGPCMLGWHGLLMVRLPFHGVRSAPSTCGGAPALASSRNSSFRRGPARQDGRPYFAMCDLG